MRKPGDIVVVTFVHHGGVDGEYYAPVVDGLLLEEEKPGHWRVAIPFGIAVLFEEKDLG